MHAWDHTAAIVAKIHNANISKASDAIKDVAQLNPVRVMLARKRQPDPTPEELADILTNAFK